jgi:putative spermidine/putrescine transport system permease protein
MSVISDDTEDSTAIAERLHARTHIVSEELLHGVLSLPLLALYILFLGVPLVTLVGVSAPVANPLSNYIEVFTNPSYRDAVLLSLGISIAVTVVSVVLGLFMAYFIARREFAGKRVIVALISFPISLPGILVAWAVVVLIGRTGVLSYVLAAFLPGEAATYSHAFGLTGLLVGYTYFTLPRTTMSLTSSIENISRDREEAARSLGASKLETFAYVTLPQIAPGIGSAVVLAFSICMAAFGTALLLASGQVSILPLKIYSVILGTYDYGAGSAMAVVLTILTVGVIYGYSKAFGGNVYEQ